MKICVLASGSSGNSTFISVDNKKILIDAGTTINNLESKLNEIHESISEIDYIFISHSHSDHTSALEKIIKKFSPTICLSEKMYESMLFLHDYSNILIYSNAIDISNIKIDFIKTSHDAADSRGFIIEHQDKSVVYITDTGYLNMKYINTLKNKNVYIFESNHDPEMLINGKYPKWLQARILSDVGHLSNQASSMYLSKLIGNNTKHVVLAHLSKENNNKDLAISVFKSTMLENGIDFDNVVVATQDEVTEVIEI